jgi:hypothetical protein
VQLDTKVYAYSDFVWSQKEQKLYTVSPGRADPSGYDAQYKTFDFITVDAASGVQSRIYHMEDRKMNNYFGGNVWSGYEPKNDAFFHAFRDGQTSELRVFLKSGFYPIAKWNNVETDYYNVIYLPSQ